MPAVGIIDRHLHEAQERAVAALGHELRVDPKPTAGPRGLRGGVNVAWRREPPYIHALDPTGAQPDKEGPAGQPES